jgi:crossover junction endodeoxyribonuclease RuvC
LNSPGFAVIKHDIFGRLTLCETFAITAPPKLPTAKKLIRIENELYERLLPYGKFDLIVREKFASPNPNTNYAVFAAWGSVDRALYRLNGQFVMESIAQSRIKKLLTGKGKAEKEQIAEAVCQRLGLPPMHQFRKNDESDAAAVVIGHLIEGGLIQ